MTEGKNAGGKWPGTSSPTTAAAATTTTSTATTISPPSISVSDFSLRGFQQRQPPSPLFPTSFSRDSTDSGFSSTATSACPSATTTPGPSTPITARKGPSLSRAGSGYFRKGLSRQDSGCCDEDKGVPSIRSRTFQVWYLRGFQLAAPEMNASRVSEGQLPGAELSKLARAAVAEASSTGAKASGKQAECVFTIGQPSTIDCRQDGSPHFSLTDVSVNVLSLKVTRGTVKDHAGAVLVTRRAGDPANAVRCHWIEFSSALELKIFTEFLADALNLPAAVAAAQAHGGGHAKIAKSESLPAGTPAAVSVGSGRSPRRESVC